MCGENLDCDGALETRVFCTVDFSHAASAQRRIDFIRPQFCPLSERHKWRDYNPGNLHLVPSAHAVSRWQSQINSTPHQPFPNKWVLVRICTVSNRDLI